MVRRERLGARADLSSADTAAPRLVEKLFGRRLERFTPNQRLTTKAEWFVAGPDVLVAVMAPEQSAASMDEVLARALAWQADRDLVLICPRARVGRAVERLP